MPQVNARKHHRATKYGIEKGSYEKDRWKTFCAMAIDAEGARNLKENTAVASARILAKALVQFQPARIAKSRDTSFRLQQVLNRLLDTYVPV